MKRSPCCAASWSRKRRSTTRLRRNAARCSRICWNSAAPQETNMTHTRRCWTLGGVLVMFLLSLTARAQESEPAKPAAETPAGQTKLSDEQATIAQQYRRFEAVLLRMAELT